MELARAVIQNYRSIKDCTINFAPRCRVLVGINEAGKSNILKALAFLTPDVMPKDGDVRIPRRGENAPVAASVQFQFSLSDAEKLALYHAMLAKVIMAKEDCPIAEVGGRQLTLREFVFERATPLYWADLITQKKHHGYYTLDSDWKVSGKWRRLRKGALSKVVPVDFRGSVSILPSTLAVDGLGTEVGADDLFEDVTLESFNNALGALLIELLKSHHPKVFLWQFADSMVLPPAINAQAFRANPETCIPLKNMFVLAKAGDISKEFARAATQGATGTRNLLDRVASAATSHLRRVWPEYRHVKFALWPDGPNIGAGIKDAHNHFDLAQRSDGFRRFASFLLLVSAQARQGKMKGNLIILDEPDTSLHPSGARCLRNELIHLSRDCYVVYATHNTSMIDRDKIARHLIVAKKNEATECSEVTSSNIADEEVLYRALGASVFESLRERNIIFEGWRDKRLFRVAMGAIAERGGDLAELATGVGTCHAYGAKDIARVCSILDLAGRRVLIVSDGDAPAKEAEKRCKESGLKEPWLRYDLQGPGIVTMEDFIEIGSVRRHLEEARRRHGIEREVDLQALASGGGVVLRIREWLSSAGIGGERLKVVMEDIKGNLCDGLKKEDIKAVYFEFLGRLREEIGKI